MKLFDVLVEGQEFDERHVRDKRRKKKREREETKERARVREREERERERERESQVRRIARERETMEGGVVVEAAAAREQKKVEQKVVEEEEELGEEALGPLQPLQVAYAYHGETLLEKAETQASKGVNWLRSALGTASGTRKVTSLSSFSCFVFFIFFFS